MSLLLWARAFVRAGLCFGFGVRWFLDEVGLASLVCEGRCSVWHPSCVRVTSHGPGWVRLGARATWRSQVSSGGVALKQAHSLFFLGASTTQCLVLDSVDPTAGPLAPRSSLKEAPARCAESRTRTVP